MFDELDKEEKIKGIVTGTTDVGFYTNKLPKGYLSSSQIVSYLKCGEAYKRRYVDEEITPQNYAMSQGTAIHKAAEKLHLSMIDNAPISIEETHSIYSDTLDEVLKNAVDIQSDKDDQDSPQSLKDVGIKMVSNYHAGALGTYQDTDTGQFYPKINPIAAERVVRVFLRPQHSEPIPFMGVVDLEEIDSVVDLKTRKKAASQLETDNSIQLTLYSHVLNKPQVRLDQLVKPTKTKSSRYLRTTSLRTKSEVTHALNITAEIAEDIAAGRFRKSSPDAWWCSEKFCAYWSTCRGAK